MNLLWDSSTKYSLHINLTHRYVRMAWNLVFPTRKRENTSSKLCSGLFPSQGGRSDCMDVMYLELELEERGVEVSPRGKIRREVTEGGWIRRTGIKSNKNWDRNYIHRILSPKLSIEKIIIL